MKRCTATNSKGQRCCLFFAHGSGKHLVTTDPPSRDAVKRIARSFGVLESMEEKIADIVEQEGYGVDTLIRCCGVYMGAMLQAFDVMKRGGRVRGGEGLTPDQREDNMLNYAFRLPGSVWAVGRMGEA
jgi:hypothetical protein